MKKILTALLGFGLGLLTLPSAAQQGARRITADTSAPTTPAASSANYRTECAGEEFALHIDLWNKKASLSTPDSKVSDISQTPLGQLLMTRRLFGHLGFACWGKGVNVMFLGFEVRDADVMESVTYSGFLSPNGDAVLVSDVSSMPLRILHQVWNDGPRK